MIKGKVPPETPVFFSIPTESPLAASTNIGVTPPWRLATISFFVAGLKPMPLSVSPVPNQLLVGAVIVQSVLGDRLFFSMPTESPVAALINIGVTPPRRLATISLLVAGIKSMLLSVFPVLDQLLVGAFTFHKVSTYAYVCKLITNETNIRRFNPRNLLLFDLLYFFLHKLCYCLLDQFI